MSLPPIKPKFYAVSVTVAFVVGFVVGIFASRSHEPTKGNTTAIPVITTTHEVTPKSPIRVEDKKKLAEMKVIPKEVANTPNKEVTAAARVDAPSGGIDVSNVLDVDTGVSQIVVERKLAEWLNKGSIGIGETVGSLGVGQQFELEDTLFRVSNFYMDTRLDLYKWDAGDRKRKFDGQLLLMLRHPFSL